MVSNDAAESPATRPESWHAILEAAVDEFSEKGFAGLRMEHVAKRAGFNKSLIYRFFTDRETLFHAALAHQFDKRGGLLGKLPEDLGELLVWWTRETRRDKRFMRMILRESLDYSGESPVLEAVRRQYYGKQMEMLAGLQQVKAVAPEFDVRFLFLALLAITIAPSAIPQVCQLVTGLDAGSDAFSAGWDSMLHTLAGKLGGEEKT